MSQEKNAVLDTDLSYRMQILEGALGYLKWSLSRNKQAVRAALSELPVRHPKVDKDWFAIKDFRLHEILLAGAKTILKTQTGELTADEVVQNLVQGLSATSGEEVKSVMFEVGKDKKAGIENGTLSPEDVKKTLFSLAKKRALDPWRKEHRTWQDKDPNHPRTSPSGPQVVRLETGDPERPAQIDSDILLDRTPMTVILSLLSSEAARPFRNLIYNKMRAVSTPEELGVLEAFLDDPTRKNRELAEAPQVVAVYGKSITPQRAGQLRDALTDKIVDIMKRDTRVSDWIDDYLSLSELGYGGGSLRLASLRRKWIIAQRVASRYLEQIETAK